MLDFLFQTWFNYHIHYKKGCIFMAKVTTYENSKLATACSFLGYLLIVCGVYCLFNDLASAGVVVVAIGFAFKLLAGFISKKKSERDAKKNQAL